jgi:hypothetical protein
LSYLASDTLKKSDGKMSLLKAQLKYTVVVNIGFLAAEAAAALFPGFSISPERMQTMKREMQK